jgi:hypothetical protein
MRPNLQVEVHNNLLVLSAAGLTGPVGHRI